VVLTTANDPAPEQTRWRLNSVGPLASTAADEKSAEQRLRRQRAQVDE
jgi:hypothetical protein